MGGVLIKTRRNYYFCNDSNKKNGIGVSDDTYTALYPNNRENYLYLWDLKKSILEVHSEYYRHLGIEHYERAFAYELYHQWAKYVEKYRKQGQEDLFINGEIKKFLYGLKKMPDMVLHHNNTDGQEIVVEIKRMPHNPNSYQLQKLIDDLKKLRDFSIGEIGVGDNDYKHSFSPYRFGVFIVTCGRISELVSLFSKKAKTIKNIIDSMRRHNKSGHLYCICCNGDSELDFATLEDLYQQILIAQKQ